MNMLTEAAAASPVSAHDDVVKALEASLYPGAKRSSIEMVLAYCAAAKLDPMQKPVHIVPMKVKKAGTRDDFEWRDVIMPGIGLYRTMAARSGQYVGKSAPKYGPDISIKAGGREYVVPEWCEITVMRRIGTEVAEFPAREFYRECYATAGHATDAPNAMWARRPRGMLAKTAEAQALRMAFPEHVGAAETAEEMEGRSDSVDAEFDIVDTKVAAAKAAPTSARAKDKLDGFAKRPAVVADPPPESDFDEASFDEGEIVEIGEDVIVGAPEMPAPILEDFRKNRKFAAALKWLEQNTPPAGPIRATLVTTYRDVFLSASKYGGEWAARAAPYVETLDMLEVPA